jgi:hypothetical protein
MDKLIEAVLQDLEGHLVRYEAEPGREAETDRFSRGWDAGYIGGLKRAISIVNYEIGIRQDPPNINYPGERPQ